MVAKSSFGHDRTQESKCLVGLHRDIAVADYPEHIPGVRSNDALSLRDFRAFRGGQGFEFHPVVQAGSLDGFPSCRRLVELGSQSMPRDFARVHHCGFAVGCGQIVGHDCYRYLSDNMHTYTTRVAASFTMTTSRERKLTLRHYINPSKRALS